VTFMAQLLRRGMVDIDMEVKTLAYPAIND
jgi:hypothetical protein